MFFNLTESPWIRAGRQYSVRVTVLVLFPHKVWINRDLRTCGRTRTMVQRSETSPRTVYLRMELSRSFLKMRVMSQPAYTHLAVMFRTAPIRMERASFDPYYVRNGHCKL